MANNSALVERALHLLQRAQRMANRQRHQHEGDAIADVVLATRNAYSELRTSAAAPRSRALLAIRTALDVQAKKLDA